MLAILALVNPALAFEVYGGVDDPSYWAAGGVIMTIRTQSISTTSSLHTATEAAVEKWDQGVIPGTDWGTDWGNSSGNAAVRVHNGLNEISGVSNLQDGACDSLAYTNLRGNEDNGIKLKEADILIDPDCSWSATLDWYDILDDQFNSDEFSLEQTLLHEMGHVAGLDHEHGVYSGDYGVDEYGTPVVDTTSYQGWPATMADGASAGSVLGDLGFLQRQYAVNEDDRVGLRFLYPDTANAGTDVAIQSYSTPDNDTLLAVEAGDCGEFIAERSRPSPYADFIQIGIDAGQSPGTCVYPLEAALLDPLPVYPYQSFEAIFSLLNLGTDDRSSVTWKVYLSPMDSVTGSSTLVATFSSDLNVNTPYERTTDLTVPGTMAAGTYYVIAVMDPSSAISEVDETNNVAVWNQQVVVSDLPSCTCSTGGPASTAAGALLALLAVVRRRR